MTPYAIPFAPPVARGAFVQLIEDVIAFIPNIVLFQYNPEKVTRGLTPWNPFEGGQFGRNIQTATAQPFDPEETISFTLQFSATEGMENGNPVTITSGVASRIAALRKLTRPSKGLLGDLVGSAQALKGGGSASLEGAKLPITFLLFGPGLVLPVRITSFSVEETMHTNLLYPHEASVTVEMKVLTPDHLKCDQIPFKDLAVGAYNFTKVQEDALALANIANNVEELIGMIVP